MHKLTLLIPGIAQLLIVRDRERFLSMLSMLSAGGVPLPDAVRGSAAAMENSLLRESVDKAADAVEHGRRLDDELATSPLMSPTALQLISSGLDAARLGELCDQAAQLDRELLSRRIALLLGALEPMLILLMGSFVLLIVIAILLPVFELNALVF